MGFKFSGCFSSGVGAMTEKDVTHDCFDFCTVLMPLMFLTGKILIRYALFGYGPPFFCLFTFSFVSPCFRVYPVKYDSFHEASNFKFGKSISYLPKVGY